MEIKCKTHNFELEIYCEQCKKMICKGCIFGCSKQNHVIMFLSDYASTVLEKRVDKLAAVVNESGPVLQKQTLILSKEISTLNADLIVFKKNIESILKDIDALIKMLSEGHKIGSEKEICKNLNSKILTLKNDLKLAKPETISEMVKRIDELEKLILFVLNFGDAFTPVKSRFYELKKMIDGDSPLENLIAAAKLLEISNDQDKWELDPNNAGPNLQLSSNNLTIEKTNSNSYSSIIGNKGFSTGVHKWDVYADSLNGSGTGHWAVIGIIAKENFVKTTDYGAAFAISTYNQSYNMTGNNAFVGSGKTLSLVLNCNEGTLSIKGEGVDMKASGLNGKTLFPYINLYSIGNKVTIIPK